MRRIALLLLIFPTLIAMGCRTGGGGDDDDDSAAGDDDDDDATDDDDAVPDTETDCSDGVDEDEDGLTDCADDDCADVAPCWWPDAVDHSGDFLFDGATIECEVASFPIDIDIDDCQTAYTSSLATETGACPVCDLTFAGDFSYSVDSCAELLDSASPTSGAFGFVFLSATEWEVYALDESTGEWASVGVAEDDGAGNKLITASEAIIDNPDECDWPKDQTLGNLTITLTWADAAR